MDGQAWASAADSSAQSIANMVSGLVHQQIGKITPPLADKKVGAGAAGLKFSMAKVARMIMNPFMMHRPGPLPEVVVTHPSQHTSIKTVKWPACIFNRAALLGSFCVDPTSAYMEKDPANRLPRLSFRVEPQKPDKATVFLLNSADGAFQRAFPYAGSNMSAGCEAVMEAATETIFAETDTGLVIGSRALRGTKPTRWSAVAVDCTHPQPRCPNITEAVITLYHPNTDSEPDSCRFSEQGALGSLLAMKSLLSETWTLKWPNPLDVIGVGPFGVAMLYTGCVVMLSCGTLFFWVSRKEAAEEKKQVHLRSSFAAIWMGLCYLAMATGNGLLVLRRVNTRWMYSDSLMALALGSPVDFDQRGAHVRSDAMDTYPLFYVRYVGLMLSTPFLLHNLCVLVSLGRPACMLAHYLNAAVWAFLATGAAIQAPSKWVFWLSACAAFGGLNYCINRTMWMHAQATKNRPTRRLFQRLSLLLLGCLGTNPIVWIFSDGAHALHSDSAISIYTCLDVFMSCICGLMLLRNVKEMPELYVRTAGAGAVAGAVVEAESETQVMLNSIDQGVTQEV